MHRAEPITVFEFAREYFGGYLRSYLAFRYNKPELFETQIQFEFLRNIAKEQTDELALEWLLHYDVNRASDHLPGHDTMQWAINFPKGYPRLNDMPTIIIYR